MKDYEWIIKKEGKNPVFYIPLIKILEESKAPLTIKEIAAILSISYWSYKTKTT